MKLLKKTLAVVLALATLAAFLPAASAVALTEKQNAIVQTALAFHHKPTMDYDSTELTNQARSKGGIIREHEEIAPEYATSDFTVYTVCSSFCWEVYWNVFGYRITEDHSKFLTGEQYTKAPEKLVVFKHDNLADPDGIEDAAQKTLQLLQPGDVMICISTTTASGHAMLYVGDLDGDGMAEIIHSSGKKYDLETGVDQVEEGGNILHEPITARLIDTATYPKNNNQMVYTDLRNPKMRYLVLRPLLDTEGTKTISAPARSRMKYTEMTIDRTVNTRRYGSAATGDTLKYTIEIENHSKSAYSNLPVSETIPNGVSLVNGSVTNGGSVSGNKITWTLNIPAGEKVTLSYDVTVTAKRGETIVSGGGMVDNIPSNTLETTVSGKAPSASKLQSANIKDFSATGTAFANEVYQKTLGVSLNLPPIKELIKAFYTQQSFSGTRLYYLNETVAPAYQTIRNMMVPNWTGGKYLRTDSSKLRNLNCHTADLQPGDIVVSTTVSASDASTNIYVWTGKTLLASLGTKVATAREANLIALQTKDVFFVLRPSLAFDDMTKMVSLPFTDVKTNDWFYTYVKDLYTDGTVNGMTATTFVPNGNLTYGQALKLIVCALGNPEQAKTGAHWASGYLTFAKKNGWLANDVNLDGAVSRLAFCQIAAKAKNLTEQPASNPFTDTSDASVLALNKAGVINGMTATTFQPGGILTRAQISKIIWLLRSL